LILSRSTKTYKEKNMMDLRFARHFYSIAALALITTCFCLPRVLSDGGVAYAQEGVEVLTHGPVHEAFAEPVEFDPQDGMLVQVPPPEPIEELPPDQIPDGEDVEWIPGYWAWDDDMNDYIWISGVWRTPPPGNEWVPGYWVRTSQGYQWVSGYWTSAEQDEVEYYPEPPAAVESGPNSYAPSPDHSWIPGHWIWSYGRYVWRPGYWEEMYPDWVYVPPHYKWTPRGYIFVGGYWDYAVPRRGILFAPVYFDFRVGMRHGFRYSPIMVINLDIFLDSLFFRPRYNHYYFGDYYDPYYYQRGFLPWFSPHSKRYGYDPIYAHQRWKHRHDRDWERRMKDRYTHRRDHRDARPSRRLPSMAEMRAKGWKTKDGRHIVAKPLEYVSENRDTSWRFKYLDRDGRKRFDKRDKDFRKYRKDRHDWETRDKGRHLDKSARGFEPVKIKRPRSPVKSKSMDRFDDKKAPPSRYKAHRPDSDVKPLKRKDDYDRPGSRDKDAGTTWKPDDRRSKPDEGRTRGDDKRWRPDDRQKKPDQGRTRDKGKAWKPDDRQKKPERGKIKDDDKRRPGNDRSLKKDEGRMSPAYRADEPKEKARKKDKSGGRPKEMRPVSKDKGKMPEDKGRVTRNKGHKPEGALQPKKDKVKRSQGKGRITGEQRQQPAEKVKAVPTREKKPQQKVKRSPNRQRPKEDKGEKYRNKRPMMGDGEEDKQDEEQNKRGGRGKWSD
jgi:hypothetical protein